MNTVAKTGEGPLLTNSRLVFFSMGVYFHEHLYAQHLPILVSTPPRHSITTRQEDLDCYSEDQKGYRKETKGL